MAFALLAIVRRRWRFLYTMSVSLHRSAVLIAALSISIARVTPARAQEPQRPSTDSPPSSQVEDAPRSNDGDDVDGAQNTKKPDEPKDKPDRVFGELPNYTSVDPSMPAPRIT